MIGTSGPIIGRYERGDMMPSFEIATKIADALEVSLDFLVGKSSLTVKDDSMLERLEDIASLPQTKRLELFNVLDAYIKISKPRRRTLQSKSPRITARAILCFMSSNYQIDKLSKSWLSSVNLIISSFKKNLPLSLSNKTTISLPSA